MNSRDTSTSLRYDLPFTTRAPAIARQHLRVFARDMPVAAADDAVVMVSELVTNAVSHGRPEITLRLQLGPDFLTVAVGDRGAGSFAYPVRKLDDTSGRGLTIVDALATRWGVSRSDGPVGKQVWFELVRTDAPVLLASPN
jgi:anti-sigma regulatory factor (Ser/Thr protein kinase)